MGRQTALDFAACGAHIVIVTRHSEQAARDTVSQIEALGGKGAYVMADTSVEADAARVVQTAVDTFGSIDIAFNNAGLGPDGRPFPICRWTRSPLKTGIWCPTPTCGACFYA